MRAKRILTYFGAWLAATTAAGTLTWLGVRDVIHETVLERPGPLPVTDSGPASQPTGEPFPPRPGTAKPDDAESDTAKPRAAEPGPGKPGPADPNAAAPDTAEPGADPATQDGPGQPPDIRNYDVDGGRAVLSVRADGVELVSAVPQHGYGCRPGRAPGGCAWSSAAASSRPR